MGCFLGFGDGGDQTVVVRGECIPESSLRNRTPESNTDCAGAEGAGDCVTGFAGRGGGTAKGATTGAAGRIGGDIGGLTSPALAFFSASRVIIPDAVPADLFV